MDGRDSFSRRTATPTTLAPWLTERRWLELKATLPAWLVQELEIMRTVLTTVDTQEKARRKTLEAAAHRSPVPSPCSCRRP